MPDRIVLTISLDPVLDPRLSPGAVRCLALLRSLAGHARTVSTLTCSLARQLGRCVNTVRAYRAALAAAGYIDWQTDPTTGITTMTILAPVEPPSRRGGAQFAAPIKPSKVIQAPFDHLVRRARAAKMLLNRVLRPQLPIRTPEQQIAILLGRVPMPV